MMTSPRRSGTIRAPSASSTPSAAAWHFIATAVALGHYVSFSGMITFRSWTLDAAIRETPGDRLLVETDAPYLAPVPRRGKRNEPGFVRHVAERIATVLGLTPEEVVAMTGANASRAFGGRVTPTA